MLHTPKSIALLLSAAAAILMMSAAPALAADTGDTLNIPLNTSFSAGSTNATLSTTVNGMPITFTCPSVALRATYQTAGLTVAVTGSPPLAFGGCTDNRGGDLTITTSGSWSLTEIDNPSETGTEPNTGDQVAAHIPTGGVSITSTALAGCTITVTASAPTASYDDNTTAIFSNAPVNVTGSGCSVSSPAHLSGTFKTNTTVTDTN